MIRTWTYTLALAASLSGEVWAAAHPTADAYENALQRAAFVKDGLERLRHPHTDMSAWGWGEQFSGLARVD